MDNFVSHGTTIEWTNAGVTTVASGSVVIVGGLVGIAATDIAASAKGTVAIEGVYEVTCDADDVITQGMKLVWDASTSKFVDTNTPAEGDNTGGVVAVTAAGATITKVKVKLLPGSGETEPAAG